MKILAVQIIEKGKPRVTAALSLLAPVAARHITPKLFWRRTSDTVHPMFPRGGASSDWQIGRMRRFCFPEIARPERHLPLDELALVRRIARMAASTRHECKWLRQVAPAAPCSRMA
jgi:hypothetical protein